MTDANGSAAIARSRLRMKGIGLTAIASVAAKAASVLTTLVSVPLTLGYLGQERFGLWMTISSLLAVLAFADLGLGNGLLTSVAKASGEDDAPRIRQLIASGLAALAAVTAGAGLVFASAYASVDWAALLGIRDPLAISEAGPAILVFTICFLLGIPAGMVQKVQLGLQQGHIAALWQCAGSLGGLAFVLAAIWFEAGLPWLVAGMAGMPVAAQALNSVVYFARTRPDLRPARGMVDAATAKHLVSLGSMFFILQVIVAVTHSSDNLIISGVLGAAAVADYAVAERLFGIVGMIFTLALMPLWSAYGEAFARGDHAWVRQTFRRSTLGAFLIAGGMALALVLAAPALIFLWVGDRVDPPILLLIGMGLWKTTEAVGQSVAVFLNGVHCMRPQVLIALAAAACTLPLKIHLVSTIGVAGAVWATVICYWLVAAVPFWFLVRRLLATPPHHAR